MIDAALADRIRTFVSALPGVQGFNILLRYEDRVEMMGFEFPLGDAAQAMTGMVMAVEAAGEEGGEVSAPIVH